MIISVSPVSSQISHLMGDGRNQISSNRDCVRQVFETGCCVLLRGIGFVGAGVMRSQSCGWADAAVVAVRPCSRTGRRG